MKAIVNIGLRSVKLTYTIKVKDLVNYTNNEMAEIFGKDFELIFYNNKVTCTHTIWFNYVDEWQSVTLFDDRMIDFHYDYENRKEFKTKKDWGGYVFQGYEYTGEPQLYDKNVVTQVIVIF